MLNPALASLCVDSTNPPNPHRIPPIIRYGSTIEGLRQLRKLKAPELAAFYEGVYRGLPLHRLLPRSRCVGGVE